MSHSNAYNNNEVHGDARRDINNALLDLGLCDYLTPAALNRRYEEEIALLSLTIKYYEMQNYDPVIIGDLRSDLNRLQTEYSQLNGDDSGHMAASH